MFQILFFIFSITLLIFVHEFGHYSAARIFGVKVDTFSIGFGKHLFCLKDKKGTKWVISIIPLGGYVRMWDHLADKSNSNFNENESFSNKSFLEKSIIVLAGPFANFIFALLLFSFISFQYKIKHDLIIDAPPVESISSNIGLKKGDVIKKIDGREIDNFSELKKYFDNLLLSHGHLKSKMIVLSDGYNKEFLIKISANELKKDYDLLRHLGILPLGNGVKIIQVAPNSFAEIFGLKKGDIIKAFNGVSVNSQQDLKIMLDGLIKNEINLNINRPNKDETFEELSLLIRLDKQTNKTLKLGIHITTYIKSNIQKNNLTDSILDGLQQTKDISLMAVLSIKRIIFGNLSLENIAGPITIASVSESSFNSGLVYFLQFLALLSISIGVVNLLPIPALDGGHFIIYLIEFFKGSPISLNLNIFLQQIGIFIIILISFLAIFNDLRRFFGS